MLQRRIIITGHWHSHNVVGLVINTTSASVRRVAALVDQQIHNKSQ